MVPLRKFILNSVYFLDSVLNFNNLSNFVINQTILFLKILGTRLCLIEIVGKVWRSGKEEDLIEVPLSHIACLSFVPKRGNHTVLS